MKRGSSLSRLCLTLLVALVFSPLRGAQKLPQAPKPPLYQPNLRLWRMDVTPQLGGWLMEGHQEIRIKLVDPKDPAPPKDRAASSRYWDESDADEFEEEAPPVQPHKGPWSAEELRQRRLAQAEQQRQNAWRNRLLRVWFNGEATVLPTWVGTTTYFTAESQNGENRLEILEPNSGLRQVITWYAFASKTRLRIAQLRLQGDEWGGGSLEVLEPNGDLARFGRRTPSGGTLDWNSGYTHPNPSPGTYTLRWTGGYRGGKPFRVVVEAVLDGGTDQERRWTFESLVLPGAGSVTLGTVDVES